jgi:hypothetical protein
MAEFAVGPIAIQLHAIGIGARQMPCPLNPDNTRCIIMAGIAGALDPSLRCGDIVMDAPAGQAPEHLPFRFGKIHTSQQIVATPAQKAALFQRTGALAVDMETALVRPVADAAGIPLVGIRAICDTAGEAIDPVVRSFVDNLGRPRLAVLAAGLLRRPKLIGELRRLSARTRRATDAVGQAVRAFAHAVCEARNCRSP